MFCVKNKLTDIHNTNKSVNNKKIQYSKPTDSKRRQTHRAKAVYKISSNKDRLNKCLT